MFIFSATFYSLPCVSDFIIDILVGCSQNDIRNAAQDQFFQLSQTEVETPSNPQTPHHFLLQVLLKAYLPFWVSSSSTRGASQRYGLFRENIDTGWKVFMSSKLCNYTLRKESFFILFFYLGILAVVHISHTRNGWTNTYKALHSVVYNTSLHEGEYSASKLFQGR